MTGPGIHHCEQEDQPLARAILEVCFCLVIFFSYFPQYLSIWRATSTAGISSHYILYHVLSSTSALSIRFVERSYWEPFNCVNNGQLRDWRAFSALVGFIQVIVQWLCSIILLVLFTRLQRRETGETTDETETTPLTPSTLLRLTGSFAIATLPVCLLLLWYNDHPFFNSRPMGWNFIVYGLIWACWANPLVLLHTLVFTPAQFIYQASLLIATKSTGCLSTLSMGLQSASFFVLAVLQLLRSANHFYMYDPEKILLISIILEEYRVFSLYIGWFIASVGYFVLFILCLRYDWHDILGRRFGWVRLQ